MLLEREAYLNFMESNGRCRGRRRRNRGHTAADTAVMWKNLRWLGGTTALSETEAKTAPEIATEAEIEIETETETGPMGRANKGPQPYLPGATIFFTSICKAVRSVAPSLILLFKRTIITCASRYLVVPI